MATDAKTATETKKAAEDSKPSALATTLIKAGLANGVDENAAMKIAEQLEKDGYDVVKSASSQLRVQPAK